MVRELNCLKQCNENVKCREVINLCIINLIEIKVPSWCECIDPFLPVKGSERCRFMTFLGTRDYKMAQLYEYFDGSIDHEKIMKH